MITLLIVSHSYEVAQGVRRLAAQMAPPELAIVALGGVPEDGVLEDGVPEDSMAPADYGLGSDATAILAAIEEHWTPAGVLILVDLGSAVMNAETALDLLPPETAAACCISNAPLVEGAIVAAVEAGLGHDLCQVNAAAEAVAHVAKVQRPPV